MVNRFTRPRKGGIVGDFIISLKNAAGEPSEFYGESFFNQHYLLTLVVQYVCLMRYGWNLSHQTNHSERIEPRKQPATHLPNRFDLLNNPRLRARNCAEISD
jgi:hypothetical protein